MIKQLTLEQYLDDLGAKKSTPGGGSTAAICGAMGAALLGMVAHYTLGKKGYEAVQDEFAQILKRAEALREAMQQGIQDDIDAFNQVMNAYRLPKGSAVEQEQRTDAIQRALKQATDTPMECARLCRETMELCQPSAEKGSKAVISDVGVAVASAYAGLKSAVLNVQINIGSIKDTTFVNQRQQTMAKLLNGADALLDSVYTTTQSRL